MIRLNASRPEPTPIQCFTSQYAANSSSKASTCVPSAAIANVGMTRLQDRANRHMAPTATKGRKAGASASGGLGVIATN